MATQTITTDFTSPVDILGVDDILVINADVTGTLAGVTAINGASVAGGRQVSLRGILNVTGTGDGLLLGLDSNPSGSSGGGITFASTSTVTVQDGYGIRAYVEDLEIVTRGAILGDGGGIYTGAGGGILVNSGKIKVEDSAIFSNTAGQQIDNSGLLESDNGPTVFLTGGGNVFVSSGTIRGPEIDPAIFFDSGPGFENQVTITGNVFSDNIAYQGNESSDELLIEGKITGDVRLGDGFNQLTIRNTTIKGNVVGGDDADTYRCLGSVPDIIEGGNGGFDRMECNRTVTLPKNVEWLQQLGSGDIDCIGNGSDNFLDGNRGNNVLKGMGGNDFFNGGRGNDVCTGGPGSDTFLIFFDSGHDKIKDLNGNDVLDLTSFGYDSFKEVKNHFFETDDGMEFRHGGCRVALADLNGDGLEDIVTWQP